MSEPNDRDKLLLDDIRNELAMTGTDCALRVIADYRKEIEARLKDECAEELRMMQDRLDRLVKATPKPETGGDAQWDAILAQPIDGLLYDLDLLPEQIETSSQRMVAHAVIEMHKRLAAIFASQAQSESVSTRYQEPGLSGDTSNARKDIDAKPEAHPAQASGWISVKDRLPTEGPPEVDESRHVHCWCAIRNDKGFPYVEHLAWNPYYRGWDDADEDDSSHLNAKVYAWQLFPDVPAAPEGKA
jgi:hypothetical protein